VTASTLPIGQGTTRRTTAPVPRIPVWVVGGLALAAVLLGVAALTEDRVVFLVAAVLGLLVGGSIVLYKPHVGVLVIMSTMLMSYPDAMKGVGPLTINNLLGATLALILGFQVYRSHDYWFLREPEVRLLITIAVWLVAIYSVSDLFLPEKRLLPSIARSGLEAREYGQSDDGGRWVFELISRVAFLIFFVNWIKTPNQLRWVLYMLGACVAIVIPTVGPNIARSETEYRVTSDVAGWAANANRFAFMMNVGIALFIYLAGVVRPVLMKLFLLLLAGACVPIVLLSASRSGFLGLGLVGFMFLISPQISRRWKIISTGAAIALAILAFNFVLEEGAQERLLNLNPFAAEQGIEGSRSSEVRMTTLGEAFTIIGKYPITGVGLANFRWVNAIMHDSYKPPHNSYIWSAAEGGLPATVLYLTLFGFLYTRIQRLRPKFYEHPVVPYLPEFLHLYLILLFFFSIFADVWLEVHLYFIISITLVLSRWVEDEELRGRGLPGAVAGTPGARRAAARALYRPGARA
jgi:O-antigen ligase